MNCKSLSIIAALSVAPLFAAVETGNTFCRIAVKPGTANVILSIPLSACGTGGDIKVTDLVLTTGLSNNTYLKAENSTSPSGWDVWKINNDNWEAVTVSSGTGQSETRAAAEVTLARGKAVWLERPAGDEGKVIYLYGQVGTSAASTPVAKGAPGAAKFTLLGHSNPEAYKLSNANNWTGCADGDQILLTLNGGSLIVQRKGGVWCKVVATEQKVTFPDGEHTVSTIEYKPLTTEDVTVPAGQGFWYRSVGGNPTINWN